MDTAQDKYKYPTMHWLHGNIYNKIPLELESS